MLSKRSCETRWSRYIHASSDDNKRLQVDDFMNVLSQANIEHFTTITVQGQRMWQPSLIGVSWGASSWELSSCGAKHSKYALCSSRCKQKWGKRDENISLDFQSQEAISPRETQNLIQCKHTD